MVIDLGKLQPVDYEIIKSSVKIREMIICREDAEFVSQTGGKTLISQKHYQSRK